MPIFLVVEYVGERDDEYVCGITLSVCVCVLKSEGVCVSNEFGFGIVEPFSVLFRFQFSCFLLNTNSPYWKNVAFSASPCS